MAQTYDMSNPEDKILLDILLNSDQADKSIGGMRRQIKELQSDMMKLDPNSDGFKEAAFQAASLKDEIDDAVESMDAFRGAGSMEGVSLSFGRLGGQLQNLDFDGAANSVRGMSNALGNIKFSAVIGGLQSLAGAFTKLAVSILTNPIFLIAATIAAVVGAIYLLIKATNEQSASQKILNEALKEVNEQTAENTATFTLMTQKLNTAEKGTSLFNKTLKEYNALAEKEGLLTLDAASSMDELNKTLSYNEKLYKSINAQKVQDTAISNALIAIKENEAEIEEYNIDLQGRASKDRHNRIRRNIADIQDENKELQNNIDSWVRVNTAIDVFIENGLTKELENQLEQWEKMGGIMKQYADQIRKMNEERQVVQTGLTKEEEEARKRAADQWRSMYEAAQKYFDTLWLKSLSEAERAKVLYERDLAEYENNLKLKLWTKEQYDNALIMRETEYLAFLAKLNKETVVKIEEDRLRLKKEAQEKWAVLMIGPLSETGILQQQFDESAAMYKDMYDTRLINATQYADAIRVLTKTLNDGIWAIEYNALLAQAQEKYNLQMQTIDTVMALDSESYSTRLGMLDEYFQAGLISEEQYVRASKALQDQRADNFKNVAMLMTDITSELFSFQENRAKGNEKEEKKVARKKFKVDKGVAAVRSVINTQEGITKALTLMPPFSFITAALTGILGAASLANILSKKFPEDGATPSSSSSSPTISSPSEVSPTSATLFGTGGGTPTEFTPFGNRSSNSKVYVLESDITNTQSDVNKVIVQSSF